MATYEMEDGTIVVAARSWIPEAHLKELVMTTRPAGSKSTYAEQAKAISQRYEAGDITLDEALSSARVAFYSAGSDAAEWSADGVRTDPLYELFESLLAEHDAL